MHVLAVPLFLDATGVAVALTAWARHRCLQLYCVFDFIRRRCDYHDFFVQINILEGSWLCTLVLMGCISVTISYSFRCLTTETVKYTNGKCFIENIASSKYSMWAQRGKQM